MRIVPCLALLLAAGPAFSQLAVPAAPDLDAIFMGRGSGLLGIKFKTDDSGAARLPQSPPHLTSAHIRRIADALAARGVAEPIVYRVIKNMVAADVVSGSPISPADWQRRIAAFESGAAALPAGATPEQLEAGVDKLLARMIARAEDPHTQYLDKDGWARLLEMTSNSGFVGIGAHVSADPAGVLITRSLPGSPASEARLNRNGIPSGTGLRRGDIIVSIDGAPLAGHPLEDAIKRLRGLPNSPVTLQVRRAGVDYDTVVRRRRVATPNSFSRMAAPGVGYVHFSAFVDDVDTDVFARIDALRAQGAAALILDVRGNPGGSLPMVQSIASEFLRDGQEITTTRARGIVISRAATDGDGRYADLPVAVLIDTGSASASEILAAVLQDHARASIVGFQSYGKGTFQSVIPTEIPVEVLGVVVGRRPDGTGAKITGGGWYGPSGRSINGRHDPATGRNVPGSGGVRPDVVIHVSDAEQAAIMDGLAEQLFGTGPAAANDPALSAAITLLSK